MRCGPTAASSASIGGCAAQSQEQTFRKYTPVFAYQFDDLGAPGLNESLPGYMWGAGHAMELAYMWPSFDNGIAALPAADARPSTSCLD